MPKKDSRNTTINILGIQGCDKLSSWWGGLSSSHYISLLARQLLAYLHYTQFVKSIKGRWFAAFQVHAQSLIFIPEPALSFNTPISSHPLSLLTLEHLSISQPNVLGLRGLNSEASVSFSKSSSSYSCDSSLAIAALLKLKNGPARIGMLPASGFAWKIKIS